VLEAIKEKRNFERLSPWLPPTPFDKEEWAKRPETYLNVVEPGRAFDVAQPAEGVEPLKSASQTYFQMKEGEAVRIAAKTEPKAPVSFTLFGNGKFDNGLGSITVQADDTGVATAVYVGLTTSRPSIVAGSPVASGTVRYRLNVTE
jgi:hypothetical protein